ncbi:hypothetical protein [Bradyrhizobium elkanii]
MAFEKLTSSRRKVPRRGSCGGTRTTVAGQSCTTNAEAIAISSPIANAQKAFLTASPFQTHLIVAVSGHNRHQEPHLQTIAKKLFDPLESFVGQFLCLFQTRFGFARINYVYWAGASEMLA